MNKKQFDRIIKQNLIKELGRDCFGYQVDDTKKVYDTYYDNETFQEFVKEMKAPDYAQHFQSYNEGDGSELLEKKGRYGFVPPKMASAASSSRFCYLALRDESEVFGEDKEVVFEYGCPITGVPGNAPQLDAKIGENIFIEAKCHEIFDIHKIVLKKKYWEHIYGPGNDFGFEEKDKIAGETFEMPLERVGIEKSHSMFDVKQFLCHLLGVSCQMTPAKLVYLFFKPAVDTINEKEMVESVFDELSREIHCLFESEPIKNFCKKHQIELCALAEHDVIMRTLTGENVIWMYNHIDFLVS